MKLQLIIGIFLVHLSIGAPPPKSVAEENIRAKIAQTPFRLTKALSYFNERMLRKLTEFDDGNVVYSPFSLHTALSLAYLGAPEGTNTSQELINLLGMDPQHTEDYLYNHLKILNTQADLVEKHGTDIQAANKLYAAEDVNLKPVFNAIISNFYNTSIDKVKFGEPEALDLINNFVSDNTQGLIPKIFEELDPMSKCVIVNAIYFKGKWLIEFDDTKTAPMEFHIDDERKIEYPYGMTLTEALRMAYIEEIGAKVLELPYQNDFFRMLILLPDEGHDIKFVERNIGLLDIKNIKARMDEESSNSDVEVLLPRFEVDFEWKDLSAAIKSLGVESIFDASKSNLTNISDDPLYISNIGHKAVITVNEEGTEAAGVTGIIIDTRSAGTARTKREFKADRPFLFYIFDSQNNIPLFVGRIVDPEGNLKLERADVGERASGQPECGEFGYDTTQHGQDSFSLPCKGQETFHIRLQEEQQQNLRDAGKIGQ